MSLVTVWLSAMPETGSVLALYAIAPESDASFMPSLEAVNVIS